MEERKLPTDGVEIKIPAPLTSSVVNPRLEIRSMALSDRHTAQFMMACKDSTECLPFYASISWPAGVELPSQQSSSSNSANQRWNDPHHEIAEGSLRAGSQATLLLDGERVHVRVRVVCLETGGTGEKVRVITTDHRQSYVAEVVSSGLLKGTF